LVSRFRGIREEFFDHWADSKMMALPGKTL
jgi:hypothetical protein